MSVAPVIKEGSQNGRKIPEAIFLVSLSEFRHAMNLSDLHLMNIFLADD